MILNNTEVSSNIYNVNDIIRSDDDAIDALAFSYIKTAIELLIEQYFDSANSNLFNKQEFEEYVNKGIVFSARDFAGYNLEEFTRLVKERIQSMTPSVMANSVRYDDAGDILDVDVKVKIVREQNED